MSAGVWAEPILLPMMRCESAAIHEGSNVVVTPLGGMPTMTVSAPLPIRPMPCSMAGPTPTETSTWSAIRPFVSAFTSAATSCVFELMPCVAPNSFDASSLASLTSTAISGFAPDSAAPWMQLRPTPPVPITTTDSPGLIFVVLIAAPTPVITPQPSSEATEKLTSLGITAICEWCTSTCSANEPTFIICATGAPEASLIGWRVDSGSVVSHITRSPREQ